jgi:hypothetical protein
MIYIQPPLHILLKHSSIGTGNQDKMSNAQSSVKLEGENSNSSTNHLIMHLYIGFSSWNSKVLTFLWKHESFLITMHILDSK